jgi:hypothetical protein
VTDILVRSLVPLAVVFVFAIARRYLPARATEVFEDYSIDELSARFALTQWIVGAGMLAMGALIGFGLRWVFASLNQFFASLEGPSDITLYPQTAIWWILPFFAGVALMWEATLRVWAFWGDRREVALYNYWTIAKAGFDSTRVLRIMAVWIVLPGAILTALALPVHAVLQNEEIRDHGYGFSGTQTYRYADARRMTTVDGFRARDGKLTRRAGIILDFADGRRWSSAFGDFEPTVDPKLLDYLRKKTGLEPQHVEAESDIPSLGQRR